MIRRASLVLALVAALPAQDNKKRLDPTVPQDEAWGKIVHYIHVSPSSLDRERILGLLKTKKDQAVTRANISEDLIKLYQLRKFRGRVFYKLLDDRRVELFFHLPQVKRYERHEFRGMEHLTIPEVRQITGVKENEPLHEDDAERVRLVVRERYKRDGYFFVSVENRFDDVARKVTIYVDEGPQVEVGELRFRGNKSFPGSVLLGFGENLQGSAKLESTGGLFGEPFSEQKVQDDIEKLELFYRRNGFLDANVHLEGTVFNEDRTKVDITFRVTEGDRYKIRKVDLQQRRSAEDATQQPRYPKEEVSKVIELAPGDYFDSLRINRDKAELERFYGKRGHPTARSYGRFVPHLFRVLEPQLVYHESKPLVDVIYKLVEGEPKKLREVRIHGNANTQDRVIRRRVKLLPGDLMDVTKLDRSRRLLDRTRYFFDRQSIEGVRFLLEPVKGNEELADLDIFVKEGETGQFTWGVGVSSGTGVRGNFEFQKRNFDITRLPSSWNPATIVSEIADGKAFHGGDQNLDLVLAPGTQISFYRLSWFDPDIFREHADTIGLRVDGFKSIRLMDSFDIDRLGGALTLTRIFDDTNSIAVSMRDEGVKLRNIDDNAPSLVWQSRGKTEIRTLGLTGTMRDLDNPLHPRQGFNLSAYTQLSGGLIGGGQDFYKFGASAEFYVPIHTDSLDRKHVIFTRARVDHAASFGDSEFVFPSERFFMGGADLRGFEQRRAGPSQFGQPLGGESQFLSTVEWQFPLVPTQMEGTTHHTEIIRGVVFSDLGMLGLQFNDEHYRQPRLTVGFGIRIQVPVLQVPIQLDLAWPILSEVTDREQQLFFSFRRF